MSVNMPLRSTSFSVLLPSIPFLRPVRKESYPTLRPYTPNEGERQQLNNRAHPIASDKELKEVDALLADYEKGIPNKIVFLEQQMVKQKLQAELLQAKDLSIPSRRLQSPKNELEFLETVLPQSILQNPAMRGYFKKGYIRLEWGEALLRASESGLNVLALIYKTKILNEARTILTEIKNSYKNKQLNPNEIGILNAIKEWEVKLQQEEQKLKFDSLKIGIKMGGLSLSILDTAFKIIPLPTFFSGAAGAALHLGGTIGSVLGLALSGINLRQNQVLSRTYQTWIKNYRNWQVKKPAINQTAAVKKRNFKKELEGVIKEQDLPHIRAYLKEFNINLSNTIQTKEQLLQKWSYNPDFKKDLIDQYTIYQRTFFGLKHVIETSENLLQKRAARSELKLMQLRPQFDQLIPKLQALMQKPLFAAHIHQHLFPHFSRQVDQILQLPSYTSVEEIKLNLQEMGLSLPPTIQSRDAAVKYLEEAKGHSLKFSLLFKQWIFAKPRDSLLKTYIDYQETIGQTTKNSLVSLVNTKHQIEGHFIGFKFQQSRLLFGLLATFIAVSAITALVALLAFPVPGAALILLVFSSAITATSFGLMGAGMYLSKKYKPSGPGFFTSMRLTFMTLYANLKEFQHVYKQKRFYQTAKMVQAIYHKSSTKQHTLLIQKYRQAKVDFEKSRQEFQQWMGQIHQLEDQLTQHAWQDFAHNAGLPADKDKTSMTSLHALQEAIKLLDLSLLDDDMKSFFETQLGINLDVMQTEMSQNPNAMIEALQNFFALDEERLGNFLRYQQARLDAGLLQRLQ
jgi:hypothetical protein